MKRKISGLILCLVLVATVFCAAAIMKNVVAYENIRSGISETEPEDNDKEEDTSFAVINLLRDVRQIDGTAYASVTIYPGEAESQGIGEDKAAGETVDILFVLLMMVAVLGLSFVFIKSKKKESKSKRILNIGFALILVISFFAMAAPLNVSATDPYPGTPDHYVDFNGSNTPPYTSWATAAHSIQDAIDVAWDGDRVHVANGTYYENISIIRALGLQGEDKNTTIIDGGSTTVTVDTSGAVTIDNFRINASWCGIDIKPNGNVTVRNCNIIGPYHGIYAEESLVHADLNYIQRNAAGWQPRGVFLEEPDYNSTVTNNTMIYQSHGLGVRVQHGAICLIEGNHIETSIDTSPTSPSDNSGGIALYEHRTPGGGSPGPMVVRGNYIEGVDWGVVSEAVTDGIIEGNYLEDVDIGISAHPQPGTTTGSHITAMYNTVNGALYWCLQVSSYSHMDAFYNTANNAFGTGGGWPGFGVYVRGTDSTGYFEGNNLTNNANCGIKVYNGSDVVVIDNTFTGNGEGYHSEGKDIVEKNTIDDNSVGIAFWGGDHTIIGNEILNCHSYGMLVGNTSYSRIIGNTISTVYNNVYGVYLISQYDIYPCTGNNIIGNTISNNEYGFYFTFSGTGQVYDNYIYHNKIIDNTIQACNAQGNNYWDNGYPSGGNYWSDFDEPSEGAFDIYSGPNQDQPGSDGIVDTPYVYIQGGTGDLDNYPFMNENGWFEDPWNPHYVDFQGQVFLPTHVVTAFINDDLLDDVVATFLGVNTADLGAVIWYENIINVVPPNYQPRIIDNTIKSPWGVDVGDLNGDGTNDVVVAGDWSCVYWYANDGLGNFSARNVIDTTLWAPKEVFIADINGDTLFDVVATGADDIQWANRGQVKWYQNLGGGTFAPGVLIDNLPFACGLYVADIDGILGLDVIATSMGVSGIFDDGMIVWYPNDGLGGFSSGRIVIDGIRDGCENIYATDVDMDGLTDIVASMSDDNDYYLGWYKGFGLGGISPILNVIDYNLEFNGLDMADIDLDGKSDIVIATNTTDNWVLWYEKPSDPLIDPWTKWGIECDPNPPPVAALDVSVADIDDDLDIDVVGALYGRSAITWYENPLI